MTRAPRTGTVIKISGYALYVAGVGLALLLQYHYGSTNWRINLSSFAVGLSLVFCGLFLNWRGRQYTAKANAERILTDSKPDVLYLRAFRSDLSTAKAVFGNVYGLRETGWTTQEEQLADGLCPIGNLVAIGQPGEELPTPGAARIYTSDEEWKDVVKRHMLAARLVIIRAGEGKNLLWELKQAVETLNPQKILILVLNMKTKHYESFRTNVMPALRVSLPEAATLSRRSGRVEGLIRFGPDWKPSFFPLQTPYFRRSLIKRYRSSFKFALRPVFESFGLEWQPPPVRVEMVLLHLVVILLLGLGLFISLIRH